MPKPKPKFNATHTVHVTPMSSADWYTLRRLAYENQKPLSHYVAEILTAHVQEKKGAKS